MQKINNKWRVMKQLDKSVERKLSWLILPLLVMAVVFVVDLLLDFKMNTINWIMPALIGCGMIPIIGFSIAYIKYKCWGLLAITLALVVIMALNMGNFFTNLLLH